MVRETVMSEPVSGDNRVNLCFEKGTSALYGGFV